MKHLLHAAQIETPLGMMLAIANEKELFFLDFVDRFAVAHLNRKLSATSSKSHIGPWNRTDDPWSTPAADSFLQEETTSFSKLERKIKKLSRDTKSIILPGENNILSAIEKELEAYFQGALQHFQTPYALLGSPFQEAVWRTLLQIPYGTTQSYAEQAAAIGNPTAVRAVANANGANRLAIVIPCHRVIASNGGLGGYGSGLRRKEWLLEHEAKAI